MRFHKSSNNYCCIYLSSSEMIEILYGKKNSFEINLNDFIKSRVYGIGIMIRGRMIDFHIKYTNYHRNK